MRFKNLVGETILAAQVNPIAVIFSLCTLNYFGLYRVSTTSGSTINQGLFLLMFLALNLAVYLTLLELVYPVYRFLREKLPLPAYVAASNRAHFPFTAALPFELIMVINPPEIVMYTIVACIYFLAVVVAALFFSIKEFYRIQERMEAEIEGEDFALEKRWFRKLEWVMMPLVAVMLWFAPTDKLVMPWKILTISPPEHSMEQVMVALEKKDEALFLKYVDLDRVLDGVRQELSADMVPDKILVLEYLRRGYYREEAQLPDKAELDAGAAWKPTGGMGSVDTSARNLLYIIPVKMKSMVNGQQEDVRLFFEKQSDIYRVVKVDADEVTRWAALSEIRRITVNAKFDKPENQMSEHVRFETEDLRLGNVWNGKVAMHITGFALNKSDKVWKEAQVGLYLLDPETGKATFSYSNYTHWKPVAPGERRGITLAWYVPLQLGKEVAEGRYIVRMVFEKVE